MKRAILLLCDDGFSSKEQVAQKVYRDMFHYDYSNEVYVGDKKLAEKRRDEYTLLAWLRKNYSQLYGKCMAGGNYANALQLVTELIFWDKDRKMNAAGELANQKSSQGLADEAKEIRQIYFWEQTLGAILKGKYGEDAMVSSRVKPLAYFLNNSENVFTLKGKKILDLACGCPGYSGAQPPWLCRTLADIGAEPVGVDINGNTDNYEFHRLDLVESDFTFLGKGSFDAINSTRLVSLRDLASMRRSYHTPGAFPKINAGGIDFYVDAGMETAPNLVEKYGDSMDGCRIYAGIARKIFDSSLLLLKEGGILAFNDDIFRKKNGQWEYLGDAHEKKDKRSVYRDHAFQFYL